MWKSRLCYLLVLLCTSVFFICYNGYISLYVFVLSLLFPVFAFLLSLPGILGLRVELLAGREDVYKRQVLFHTDAVQAVGNVHIDVKEQNIDMLSLSGHKLHAPKGVGALYIRTGVVLPNFIDGGAQERGKRGGTENVASIVGLATAMEQACSTMDQRVERLTAMRDKLIGEILKIDRSRLNGHPTQRLPGNASFCFQGVEGESLLLMLDLKGIIASSGSACTSGSLDPSHVLLAIGLPHEVAHGSLRLSFGDYNTMEDIDYIIETLPPIIERLRSMSPLWDAIQQGRVNYDQYTEQ